MSAIKHSAQRVAVLIDVQNFYHSAKHLHKRRVNFREILKTAVGERQLIRAFAYVITTESGEEKSFFEVLKKMGIEIRAKELLVYYGGLKKGDWDVGVTIDAISLSDSVDVIVLMSGDGDFVPLVEYLKNNGTRVEVVGFGKSASSKLREVSDLFIDLDKDTDRYLLKKKLQ